MQIGKSSEGVSAPCFGCYTVPPSEKHEPFGRVVKGHIKRSSKYLPELQQANSTFPSPLLERRHILEDAHQLTNQVYGVECANNPSSSKGRGHRESIYQILKMRKSRFGSTYYGGR